MTVGMEAMKRTAQIEKSIIQRAHLTSSDALMANAFRWVRVINFNYFPHNHNCGFLQSRMGL